MAWRDVFGWDCQPDHSNTAGPWQMSSSSSSGGLGSFVLGQHCRNKEHADGAAIDLNMEELCLLQPAWTYRSPFSSQYCNQL